MLFFVTIIALLKCMLAFEPQCSSCKYFIPNVKIFDDLGLCRMFKDTNTSKGKQYTLYNYAVHCRENENLCGKSGFLYESIYKKENTNTNTKANDSNKLFKELNEDAKFLKKIDETEQLEKEFFDIMQKIKKHNKKQVYNTTKDLYKLFKRDNK